jgi:hypothetical protein
MKQRKLPSSIRDGQEAARGLVGCHDGEITSLGRTGVAEHPQGVHARIVELAYQLYELGGYRHGHDERQATSVDG